MSLDALSFDFKLTGFDLTLLRVDEEALKGNEPLLRSTLQEHLRELFEHVGGECRIVPHGEHISVVWVPETDRDMDSAVDLALGLIRGRAFYQAETILRTLLSRAPDDRGLLLNLGAMLCEQGRLRDAREVLRRLTRKAVDFAKGWNALGVALSREGKRKEAEAAFRKGLELDPQDGYTLRNLGALLGRKDPEAAMPYLKRAAKLLPSDQPAQYTYAGCLMEGGRPAEADPVLKKAIALDERSEVADLCREARMEISRRNLKGKVPAGLSTNVVVFCLAALETVKEVGPERTKAIVFEISSLASSGLNINDRTSRFRLHSLPGEFSALQLVALMYVGLKEEAPGTDAGIDFSREYAFALTLLRGKRGKPGTGAKSKGVKRGS